MRSWSITAQWKIVSALWTDLDSGLFKRSVSINVQLWQCWNILQSEQENISKESEHWWVGSAVQREGFPYLYKACPRALYSRAHWGWLSRLVIDVVCLFVYSCSEQRGIMGQSRWVSSRHGHALLLSAPSATSLLQEVPENRKCVCVSPSQKPSLTHRGSMGTWQPGGEGDCNLQHRLQDGTVLRPFIKGATELVLHIFFHANQALYI